MRVLRAIHSAFPEMSLRGAYRALLRYFFVLLLVLSVLRVASAQVPGTILFSDDAERAVMENWVWNGWAIDHPGVSPSTAQAHSGLYSYASTTTGAATGSYFTYNPGTTDPIFYKFWVYVPSAYSLGSNSTTRIAALFSTSTYVAYPINLTQPNTGLYLNASGLNGTHAITRDTWHAVEMQYNRAAGTITVWLDGTQDITASGLTLAVQNAVYIGLSAGSGTVYVDDISVSSAASGNPTAGITVRHAYPGNRSAFRAKTYLWGTAATDTLLTTVDGVVVSSVTGPANYQEPVIAMSGLAVGNHTLVVSLNNSSGATRVSWTETINKSSAGTPLVGIDENNNLIKGGHKLFPITPWIMNADNINLFLQGGYINASGVTSQYASSYSVSQYQSFLEGSNPVTGLNCRVTGTLAIGPGSGRGGDYNTIANYASSLTTHPCILGWFGYDEASVNGIPTSSLTALVANVHAADNNHPAYYDDATFPYLHQEWYYPTFVADIYSSDNYPICYSNSYWGSGQRTYTDWVHELDREGNANYWLVPNWNVIEIVRLDMTVYPNFNCTSTNHAGTALSSPIIYNESWMAIIHGRKGLSWYNDAYPAYGAGYSPTCTSDTSMACFPPNSSQGIGKVVDQVRRITPDSLLGYSTRTVISNQTSNCAVGGATGRRVDVSVREDSNYAWVFAARLTDPLCNSSENSLGALNTQIAVSGLTGTNTVTVFDESRTLTASNGVFTDSFNPWAVHIYQIPLSRPAPPTGLSATVN